MLKFHTIPVTPLQQNCNLIWDSQTNQTAVLDPGGDLPRILQAVQDLDLHLEQIWLTHAHIDHAGAAGELAQQMQIPILGPHRDDAFLIKSLPQQSQMFGMPPAQIFEPTRWLDENNRVQIGNQHLHVHHTPGHTPGHIIFYAPQAQLAFVGDVLFVGSIGRTDLPGGNHHQLLESISQKLLPMGDEITFVPGHGPLGTIGQERIANPFVRGL